jgi:hypothetical protein
MRVRKLVLFGGLAGIVAFLSLDRPQAPAPAVGTAASSEKSSPPDSLKVPDRNGLTRARGELFGAPPPPPQAAAPMTVVPTPVAPPVPYRFAGKVRKGAEEEVLITKGDIVFAVKVGDTLDGSYRVESIDAERIELLYLPLGTKDRILVSSALDGAPASLAAATPQLQIQTPTPAQTAEAGPARLRWEGPDKVAAGAAFSVTLRVNTKEALRAAPMQLRFEPGVLEPVQVRPGKFFGQGNFTYRVNPEGSIFVGASSGSAAPAVSPGGDAELLVVTFRPIKRGATAELSMSALSLQGAAGRAIAHEQPSTFRTSIQ